MTQPTPSDIVTQAITRQRQAIEAARKVADDIAATHAQATGTPPIGQQTP